MYRLALFLLALAPLVCQAAHRLKTVAFDAEINGLAADGDAVYTWGKEALRWTGGRPVKVAESRYGFHSGGCAMGAIGAPLLVLAERGRETELGDLVAFEGASFRRTVIDTGVALTDCLPATLFGRRGFLMIHRSAQIRFYWRHGETWSMQDIYSIYTASRQGGLAMTDVDGDGLPDIYCGNYWVKSPADFALPWRIFAINLHHAEDDAANFHFAAWPGKLFSVQRERDGTPLREFVRPRDPRNLWREAVRAGVDGRAVLTKAGDRALVAGSRTACLIDPSMADARDCWSIAEPAIALAPVSNGVWIAGRRSMALWTFQARRR